MAGMIGKLRPAGSGRRMVVVSLIFVGSIVTGWHSMIDSIAGILLGWASDRIAVAVVPPEGESTPDEEGMMRGTPAPASERPSHFTR
jgi:hypothetical protein